MAVSLLGGRNRRTARSDGQPARGPTFVLFFVNLILSMLLLFWAKVSNNPNLFAVQDVAVNAPRKLSINSPKTSLLRTKNGATDAATLERPTSSAAHTLAQLKVQPKLPPSPNLKQMAAQPELTLPEWRTRYNLACQDDTVQGEAILEMVQQFYQPATTGTPAKTRNTPMEPCQYTVLDFGSNLGDSLARFIDSGWDRCYKTIKGVFKYGPRYNLYSGAMDQFYEHGDNEWAGWARPNKNVYPEDVCYFGIEGNPIFTARLQALQARVMASHPRPVQSAHFFTETMEAGVEGPPVSYLNAIGKADHNFWDQSTQQRHKLVEVAPVQDRTLSRLVQRASLKQPGSHLLLKVDTEGADYDLFQEVHQSGVLCDYAATGVTVTMKLQKHLGLDMAPWNQLLRELKECGVIVQ